MTEYVTTEDEVCLYVCVSQQFVAKPFGKFRWNFTQILTTKIQEDTFLIFFNFWFDDVITAFFVIS